MKLSELVTKLQHELVHANAVGKDPEVMLVVAHGVAAPARSVFVGTDGKMRVSFVAQSTVPTARMREFLTKPRV